MVDSGVSTRSVGTAELPVPDARRRQSGTLRKLLRNKGATLSLVILVAILFVAVAAPAIAPYDPEEVSVSERLGPPSPAHLMGTDQFGRDVLSRTLYGTRITLSFALVAVFLSTVLGVVPGLLAGYVGGYPDAIITRIVDVMLAFPGILLALIIVAILGVGLQPLIWAIAISYIPVYIRLVRASVIATKENLYVEAARQLGCSTSRIAFRHILPNVVVPVLVTSTTAIAWAILAGTALNFIGLGVQPPIAEWGADMADGRNYMRSAWWITMGPGVAIMITIFAVNLFGDWLATTFDPRLRKGS